MPTLSSPLTGNPGQQYVTIYSHAYPPLVSPNIVRRMTSTRLNAIVSRITNTNEDFALATALIRGEEYLVFKNAPLHLRDMLERSWAKHENGQAEYIVYEGERWTYAKFCADVRRTAWTLRNHFLVTKGVPVAIAMRNYPEFPILIMAISALGARVIFLNAWWTTEELKFAIVDSAVKLIFADGPRAERIKPLVEPLDLELVGVRDAEDVLSDGFSNHMSGPQPDTWPDAVVNPDDDFAVMYTAGTTAHPKGVVLTHRGAINAVYTFLMQPLIEELKAGREQKTGNAASRHSTIAVTPLFHVTASHGLFLQSLPLGAKLCLMYKWDAEQAVRIIRDEKVTRFIGVPTQSIDLMEAARRMNEPLETLQSLTSGGAKRPAAQVSQLQNAFPQLTVATGWGMTETNAVGIGFHGDEYLALPDSVGRLQPPLQELKFLDEDGREVATGEIGELTVKSACNMRCYLNQPEETDDVLQDGWFRTGDLGRIDADDIVTIVDRKKNIVIRGGENIACLEIEGALHRHPSVIESCVFAIPDDRLGETLGAGIRVRSESTVTPQDLQTFLMEHVARFKIPEHVWVQTDPLPRNSVGKLDRRKLRAISLEQLH